MKAKNLILGSSILVLFFFSCSVQNKTYIVTGSDKEITEAGKELAHYLSKTYPDDAFEAVTEKIPGNRNILLEIPNDTGLENSEAFQISGEGRELFIRGKTSRALFHGVYGLLKHLGWNFYLSFEVPPAEPAPLDFSTLQLDNTPLKGRRILFNWHNFLSGCTGWDLEQWQQWIDNGSKIGFNTVMVHAYGNNPMHSFSFNGQEKGVGYLATSQKGRDWGTQHVNDVRLIHGGEFFDDEFGSQAAKVEDDERRRAATQLMQQVFKHAQTKAMDVCFALDVDTWTANPQNIIKTLPGDALIQIGGYQTVNPDHPEGKKYYEAQLKQLFTDYPEITMLAVWMRRPGKKPESGSIWLSHDSNTLPVQWREEYFGILENHPELKDEAPYPGLFAISKIVKVYREILDALKPDVELVLGSWDTDYTEQADVFMPDYCGFIPLDYSQVLDRPDVKERLEKVGDHRKLYPVVWAHHDDHRYLGRPYMPYTGFHHWLEETNSSGYGIIHWTTHPLDLFFNNYENQVWKNSENETWEEAVAGFSESLLKGEENNLQRYYQLWFHEAPMFGRETFDYLLPLHEDYNLDGYDSSMEVVKKAKERLTLLEGVDTEALNSQGVKEYYYQLGMEQFIISFFTNHHYGYTAYRALQNGDMEEALLSVNKLNAEETIQMYARTIKEYNPTRGEEGILVSLNLRWLPDYIDLKQRTGLEPIRINFQPTAHEPLAQGAGNNTFFTDKEQHFWLSIGEKESGIPCETNGKWPLQKVTDSWMVISGETNIPIKTMRKHNLSALNYEIKLIFDKQSAGCQIQVLEDNRIISDFSKKRDAKIVSNNFKASGGEIFVKIIPDDGIVKLAGIELLSE